LRASAARRSPFERIAESDIADADVAVSWSASASSTAAA